MTSHPGRYEKTAIYFNVPYKGLSPRVSVASIRSRRKTLRLPFNGKLVGTVLHINTARLAPAPVDI